MCPVPCLHRAVRLYPPAWISKDLPTSDPRGLPLSLECKQASGASRARPGHPLLASGLSSCRTDIHTASRNVGLSHSCAFAPALPSAWTAPRTFLLAFQKEARAPRLSEPATPAPRSMGFSAVLLPALCRSGPASPRLLEGRGVAASLLCPHTEHGSRLITGTQGASEWEVSS